MYYLETLVVFYVREEEDKCKSMDDAVFAFVCQESDGWVFALCLPNMRVGH